MSNCRYLEVDGFLHVGHFAPFAGDAAHELFVGCQLGDQERCGWVQRFNLGDELKKTFRSILAPPECDQQLIKFGNSLNAPSMAWSLWCALVFVPAQTCICTIS